MHSERRRLQGRSKGDLVAPLREGFRRSRGGTRLPNRAASTSLRAAADCAAGAPRESGFSIHRTHESQKPPRCEGFRLP